MTAVRGLNDVSSALDPARTGAARCTASKDAKRILMIAFHFPPFAGSSGMQRTLRFVQHLPNAGWHPIVLSARPHAYECTGDDLVSEIPVEVPVRRAFALDAGRHLSLNGRFPACFACPDRWVSWRFDGVRQGLKLIRDLAPDVVWSTHPIPTAHLIAAELHKRSGIAWVADFRDPMVEEGYPTDAIVRRSYGRIEREVFARARYAVFTTPGAAAMYRARYPFAADRIAVIENGYDEDSFASPGRPVARETRSTRGPVVVLHSGLVYPTVRDPTPLFVALQRLLRSGRLLHHDLRIRFRGSMCDPLVTSLACRHGLEAVVETGPLLPYREALAEMMAADALLVIQGADCNRQIPAKVYEYLRTGRPIIALTDPAGDTAGVLRAAGVSAIARPDSACDIASVLPEFVAAVRSGAAAVPDPEVVASASRRARSESFARLLDTVARQGYLPA